MSFLCLRSLSFISVLVSSLFNSESKRFFYSICSRTFASSFWVCFKSATHSNVLLLSVVSLARKVYFLHFFVKAASFWLSESIYLLKRKLS